MLFKKDCLKINEKSMISFFSDLKHCDVINFFTNNFRKNSFIIRTEEKKRKCEKENKNNKKICFKRSKNCLIFCSVLENQNFIKMIFKFQLFQKIKTTKTATNFY